MDEAAMNPNPTARRLVLIGAGHTNLQVVHMWRQRPIPGVSLTLISPFDRATYSGMLPGTLAGLYESAEMEIELLPLAEHCGAELIVAAVTQFDSVQREIRFDGRPPIGFDIASIGIGSVPGHRELWQGRAGVLSLKPMATFLERLQRRIGDRTAANPSVGRTEPLKIMIVGGGAAGVEVAFCLDERLRSRGLSTGILLVDAHDEILSGYSSKAVRLANREMDRRGILFAPGRRIIRCEDGPAGTAETVVVTFDDETSVSADLVIWATGASAPPVLEQFDLPKTADGFPEVRPTLQSTADLPVFIVGDTAGFVDEPVPKAGVYAVREGPILCHNLRALVEGQPLIEYKPQHQFLSLLSTGDGRAIMEYHGFSFHTRWAGLLKDRIDRRFMARFRV